jgi:hypothetical protein
MLRQELITTYTGGQIYTMTFRVRTNTAIKEINVMGMQVSEFKVSCRLKETLSVHLEFHCNQIAACICQFVIFSV